MTTATKDPLTARQSEILDFIRERIAAGASPSIREIGSEFSINSPTGVTCHLEALEKKGYIRRRVGQVRNIELTGVNTCPHCGREV